MGEARRRKQATEKAPCYCGSGKPARICCFNGTTFYKPPALLGLRDMPETSTVERCYMAALKSCRGPISGEHLISESVMHVLADEGEFTIGGLPWIPEGEFKSVGFKSLVANCLCKDHNSALHPLDDAAASLFGALRSCFEDDSKEHRFLVNGHDIERWLLKTLKAMAVSGNLAQGRERLSGAFASDVAVIKMLDHPDSWPAGAGLYCIMRPGDLTANHNRFQLQPILNGPDDELVGIWANIIGLSFILLLDPQFGGQIPALASAVYRPGQILVETPRRHSWVAISWIGEGALKQTLSLKYIKTLPSTAPTESAPPSKS